MAQRKFSTKRHYRWGDIMAVVLLLVIVIGVGWFWWGKKHPSKTVHHRTKTITQPTLPVAKPVAAPIAVPSVPVRSQSVPVPPTLPPETKVSAPPTNTVTGNAVVTPVPVPIPAENSRPVRDTLETQVALARLAISPGSIDSANGSQTRAAIAAFQRMEKLTDTGILDTNTRARLLLTAPVFTTYTVTSNDLAGLQPIGKTWLEKSHQTELAYETELERVAETAHASPLLIKKFNPGVDWTNLAAGAVLKIPDVTYPEPEDKAAFVVIHLSDRFLEAFDTQTNLIAHFPCSIAAKVEKRPVGALEVETVIPNPNYTVNPELFPESEELQELGRKIVLPPGPNNPVGVAWIGLNRPGYGMHGTPVPEQVGRTESHGCFRLANWDAAYMVKLAWAGMPVYVEP